MNDMKIAVFPQVLDADLKVACRMAAEKGIQGLHLTASGPLHPDNLDAQARRDLVTLIHSHGLVVSALCCWGGEVDLTHREQHAAAIPAAKQVLDLAVDLESGLWQGHVGICPWETDHPGWHAMVDGISEMAEYGEQIGATLCLETGPEPPWVFKRLMETVNKKGLGVNYDPANLILWRPVVARARGEENTAEWAAANFHPESGAELLAPWIYHTHAKDAKQFSPTEVLEVPLGEGDVDWVKYVGLLQAAGYDGFYAIEREVGEDRVGDIMRAVDFLRSLPV